MNKPISATIAAKEEQAMKTDTCEAKREAYNRFRADCDEGVVALAPMQTFYHGFDAGYAAASARPATNDVALAIAYWETTLKHNGERFGKGEDHMLRTLIDAAASRWRSIEKDGLPCGEGWYLMRVLDGSYRVGYIGHSVTFLYRDFTHYQKIEPPSSEEK